MSISVYAGQGLAIQDLAIDDTFKAAILHEVFGTPSESIPHLNCDDFDLVSSEQLNETWHELWHSGDKGVYSSIDYVYSGMDGKEYLIENCVKVLDDNDHSSIDMTVVDGEAPALNDLMHSIWCDHPIQGIVVVTHN